MNTRSFTLATLLLGFFLSSSGLAAQPATQQPATQAPATAQPDLIVELQTPMSETVVIRNIGEQDAPASKAAIGCSRLHLPSAPVREDCVLGAAYSDTSDREVVTVATVDVPPLPAGETATLKVPYWRDLKLDEEPNYRFRVIADSLNQVDEADEDNNVSRSHLLQAPVGSGDSTAINTGGPRAATLG